MMTRASLRIWASLSLLVVLSATNVWAQGEDETEHLAVRAYPPLITAEVARAIEGGVRYLASQQRADGSWADGASGYPIVMTSLAGLALISAGHMPTRGLHAKRVRDGISFLIRNQNANGLIGAQGESRHMYGHGFAMLFLGTALGNTDDRKLQRKLIEVLELAVKLTIQAQSTDGGWYYTADSRTDEGSVTVTQMQGLRACRNAGINVPEGAMRKAVDYLKKCQNPDGGITYSLRSRGGSRDAISAAAVACMYSAGAYDDASALKALAFCKAKFGGRAYTGSFYFYTNFYWAQAMFQTNEQEWNAFFPHMRQSLLTSHRQGDAWNGATVGGTGPIYGTSLALLILTLPYQNVPVFQR
jgi:hypothetical protein